MTEVWDEKFAQANSGNDDPLGIDATDESYPSEALISLLHVGKLSKEVVVRGHRVRLRTLTMGEELEIGPLIQRYNGTPEEGRAYVCAIVASAIDTVDDMPLVEGLGPQDTSRQQRQFDYLRSKWYWAIIQEVYEHYVALQADQLEAIKELQSK